MTAATQPEQVEPQVGQLPAGWVETHLDHVAFINARPDTSALEGDSLVTFIPMAAVEEVSGVYNATQTKSFDTVKKGYTPFKNGDIIFAKITPCMENGKSAIVENLENSIGYGSTEFHVITPMTGVEKKLIFYLVTSRIFRHEAEHNMRGAAGQKRVPPQFLANHSFPLPPLPEQRRIVSKIEELFSKLDAGVTELKRTRALLKRYRQSVLHAAVTGELSRGWREAQGGELEDARHLLAHLLDERRARWAASGKRGKYAEPQGPDVAGLPELPQGWVWATLPQLGELGRGKSKHRPRNAAHLYGGPYPFIQTGDVRRSNGLIKHFDQTYSESGLLQSRLWEVGTLCITIAANIAETGILSFASCFPDSVVGFVPESPRIFAGFYEVFLRSEKSKIEQYAPATAQKNINLDILNSIAMPLPSSAEQSYIVTEVERRLSILANVEATVENELKRAESTRQGILRRAFAGQLVPQDAADEPASVLLERIQAERVAAGAASVRATGRRGRKPKTTTQVALLGPGDA